MDILNREENKTENKLEKMRSIVIVNNEELEIEYYPDEYILEVLRRYGYKSLRRGCDTMTCGACTILVDGKVQTSCSYFAARAEGHSITTIEGVQEEGTKIAEMLRNEGVDQCGYCGTGLVMTIIGYKNEIENRTEDPTDDEILEYFQGNLCRCTGYVRQLKVIKEYVGVK